MEAIITDLFSINTVYKCNFSYFIRQKTMILSYETNGAN